MSRCLCCNKGISGSDNYEISVQWHRKCIRSFFGTSELPEINCTEEELEKLANTTVSKGLSVPGVQKKLSLHLDKEHRMARLTVVDYPTGYILKPQSDEYTCLPEAEFLSMKLAESAGIQTVPNALIRVRNRYAYITKRVDRGADKLYAMEDFCQLSGRVTADKYKGSYENCGKIIRKYSRNVGLDITELYYRLLFCYMTGNSDMHLKNFSLREREAGNRVFVLSEAYDLLPVNIVMPADTEQTALTLNGKKRNIRKNDFIKLSESFGIQTKPAENMIKRMTGYIDTFISETEHSYIDQDMKERMIALIRERADSLQ